MSQLEKLWQRIRNNPKTVRFSELEKILQGEDYSCRQPRKGSSHYIFSKPGQDPLTIPKNGSYVKEKYVRMVIKALAED